MAVRYRWLACALAIVLSALMPAAAQSDTARIEPLPRLTAALLTCSPGQETYEVYGHTALLVRDTQGESLAYNYGVFSFSDPDFGRRFVLGQPDYWLAVQWAPAFLTDYVAAGRGVVAQRLRLTGAQAVRLDSLLRNNALPDNRVYRYNVFTDNCTTRALRMLQQVLGDSLMFDTDGMPPATYRSLLHAHLSDRPWQRLGQDLLLGAAADTLLSAEAERAFPLTAQKWLRRAYVRADGRWQPLVETEDTLVEPAPRSDGGAWLSPMAAILFLLLVALFVSHRERAGRRVAATCFDALFYLLLAAGGCVVAFLFFCSEHPTVGSNWLISLFSPIAFVLLALRLWSHRSRGAVRGVALVGALMLCGFAVGAFFQNFPPETFVLALILLIRILSPLTAK